VEGGRVSRRYFPMFKKQERQSSPNDYAYSETPEGGLIDPFGGKVPEKEKGTIRLFRLTVLRIGKGRKGKPF